MTTERQTAPHDGQKREIRENWRETIITPHHINIIGIIIIIMRMLMISSFCYICLDGVVLPTLLTYSVRFEVFRQLLCSTGPFPPQRLPFHAKFISHSPRPVLFLTCWLHFAVWERPLSAGASLPPPWLPVELPSHVVPEEQKKERKVRIRTKRSEEKMMRTGALLWLLLELPLALFLNTAYRERERWEGEENAKRVDQQGKLRRRMYEGLAMWAMRKRERRKRMTRVGQQNKEESTIEMNEEHVATKKGKKSRQDKPKARKQIISKETNRSRRQKAEQSEESNGSES